LPPAFTWLASKASFGFSDWLSQELIDEVDRQYDLLRIQRLYGKKKEIRFEITEFYGR